MMSCRLIVAHALQMWLSSESTNHFQSMLNGGQEKSTKEVPKCYIYHGTVLNITWRHLSSSEEMLTLPRAGFPSKMDEKKRGKLVRKAAKKRRATLKKLQDLFASTDGFIHVTTISRLLHMLGLRGRVET